MPSERLQRQIDRLLDQIEAAAGVLDWHRVQAMADAVLRLDPENEDARAYLAAAMRDTGVGAAPAAGPSPTPVPAPTEPASFASGRYRVLRFLGEGGKKKVYLAHDGRLDRDVAFALIKTEGLDEEARERITREAQAMGRLGNHPNIVTVYDIGEEDGQPYMVLPVLAGGDVEGLIEKAEEHKLAIERAVQIAVDVCQGLEAAHGHGIVHRDLKPGNVWLTEDGRAMIGDFGLAVAVDRSRLTQAGMMVGTVSYMPPEQAMGGEVTPRSDLYSLGAMLYEMACGRPPFVGDDSIAIIGQHLNTPPVAPTWHRPDCPPALEALILRLLEKDPQRRPASAREVRESLSLTLSHGEREATFPLPGGQGGRRPGEAEATPASVADPLYRTVFVGREQELRQLQQAYDAAVSGHGGLVMVVGEPGIGKTALCEQLATYVSIRGGRTLVGHCYEEGSLSLPYLAFVEAMRSYVLSRDPEGLRSDLGSGAAEVARIVSEVRHRVQVELRDASDPEDDRWRLLQSVTTFLRNAAAVQPLVIVLEDLHWADRGTLDLLQHVARNLQGARLVVVGTYRDVEVDRTHPLSGTLAELRRIGNFLRIPLRGLTVDEVHRMYEQIRGNEVAWGQAELVHRQTEGNPLFVQEVLRYLVEEGIVVRQDGRYVARTPGEGVPEGLRDVVGRRLNNLSEKANQVLSVASVIGRDFTLEVLQRVAGMNEDDVLAALEEATARSIIEQRPATGSVGFRFTHAFFRQTLYEEIFVPRRIRLHEQVGRALEEVHARRLEEHAAEMAEHFTQSTEAADLEKAVRYGELAAQRAMNVFAYGEAVRHLEQALRAQEVLDPDDRAKRYDLITAQGEAMLRLGEPLNVSEEIAVEALRLAEALGDFDRAFGACHLAFEALLRYGERPFCASDQHERAEHWLERAQSYAAPGTAARAWADAWAATYEMRRSPRAEAARSRREILDLVRQADNLHLEVCGTVRAAAGPRPPGEKEEQLRLSEAVLSQPLSSVSTVNRVEALWHAGETLLEWGQRDRAEKLWQEAGELASRTNDAYLLVHGIEYDVISATLDGRFEDAIGHCERLVRRGEELGSSGFARTVSSQLICDPLLFLGQAEVALPHAGFREGDVGTLLRSLCLAQLGRHGEAIDGLHVITQQLEEVPTLEMESFMLVAGLHIALALGERSVAMRLAQPLVTVADLLNIGGFSCSVARLLGEAHVLDGNGAEARHYLHRGLVASERVRFRPETALIHLDMAELLLEYYPEERDAAIEHLDFAIRELREMKMQPALERALRRRGLLKA